MDRPPNTTSSSPDPDPLRVAAIRRELGQLWPDAVCELDHQNGFQLLCATILAAQSTDKMINAIGPALFARYPDAHALAAADPAELEPLVFKSGFYRAKARSLIGMARALVERHDGRVPATMAELVALPGVARKTANVILWTIFGKNDGVVVDTHVTRLAQRLGLSASDKPEVIERDLQALIPRAEWGVFAHRVIWHGRRICFARNPACGTCALAPLCPSANIPGRGQPAGATAKSRATRTSPGGPTAPAASTAKSRATRTSPGRPTAPAASTAKNTTGAKAVRTRATRSRPT